MLISFADREAEICALFSHIYAKIWFSHDEAHLSRESRETIKSAFCICEDKGVNESLFSLYR